MISDPLGYCFKFSQILFMHLTIPRYRFHIENRWTELEGKDLRE